MSLQPAIERAKPLLGTRVVIAVDGLPTAEAHQAIDQAFASVAHIHQSMSFHADESDVARLNRTAHREPVAVAEDTYQVLRLAQQLARETDGSFDVTVASQLVEWSLLPRPAGCVPTDPQASFRDIELLDDGRIRFHRPLWIDLGGIAKGYAVDCAIAELRRHGVRQASVNAGGDLRVMGPTAERVRLRPSGMAETDLPILEIRDGSVASSDGRPDRRQHLGKLRGPHVDGRVRGTAGLRSFVSVVAERCVVADALTKVVLARGGERCRRLLARHGAIAHRYSTTHGWRSFGDPV